VVSAKLFLNFLFLKGIALCAIGIYLKANENKSYRARATHSTVMTADSIVRFEMRVFLAAEIFIN